jgi:hypothetical protein
MSRPKENEAAFSEGEQQIGKLRLRPFTIGTLSICRQLKLTMFIGSEEGTPELDQQRQIMAFAWAQSAPLGEVLRCIRTGKWVEAVEEFEFEIEPSQVNEIVAEINRISQSVKAAAVEVEEKPGHGTENAPPN